MSQTVSFSKNPFAVVETLSVSSVAAPSPLALFVIPFVFAAFPFPFVFMAPPLALVRPLAPPLLMPTRRLAVFPLAPVSGLFVVITHRHEQDGTGHELGSDHDPRAVVLPEASPAVACTSAMPRPIPAVMPDRACRRSSK